MKKILSIQLAFCLVLSILFFGIPVRSQALNDLQIVTGGTTSKITYSQVSGKEEIRVFSSSTKIYRQSVIAPEGSYTNYRLCFEIEGVSVSKTYRLDVNKGTVAQIRAANLSDPTRTSVVVETSKKPDYTLKPASDGKSLVLTLNGLSSGSGTTPAPSSTATPKPSTTATPKPSTTATPKPSTSTVPASSTPKPSASASSSSAKNGPLSWSMSADTCNITLSGISLSQTTTGNVPRFELREKEKILQITLPGNDTRFKTGYLPGNSVIYGALVNYNVKQDSTIIRISYANTITYTHTVTNGSSVIMVKKSNSTVPTTSTPKPSASTTPKPSASTTPKPSASSTPIPVNSSTPTPANPSGANAGFTFYPGIVSVSAPDFSGVKVYRLGSPSRIVMEFTGTAVAADKLMPSGSLYNRAVVTQASSNTVKVELYTDGIPEWSVSQSTGRFSLSLERNGLTYIEGGNLDGKVALRLVSPGIVSRYHQYGYDVVLDDNDQDGTFSFLIPTSIVKVGGGTAKIENGLVESIAAFSTAQNSFLLMNKNDRNMQFKIIEGSGPDELLVVVATSEGGSAGSRLVVLDPGHGGSDPGGTVGSYFEKNYNLDIALKCEAILKARGINVAMTRRTDVFVGLDERAEFANNLKATLFLSIHNNIMPTGYKGSMTLYYPSSYDGKAYARIIQNNMVRDLKAGDIGLKASGGLVVLKKTKMTAVLAEVACMSYPDDLNLLNTETFRQKAAESLANSVIEILNSK